MFQVGDRVYIREDMQVGYDKVANCSFVDRMCVFKGQTAIVEYASSWHGHPRYLLGGIDGIEHWQWIEDWLLPADAAEANDPATIAGMELLL